MKIIAKLAKEVFNSGKAIGFETNITNATSIALYEFHKQRKK